MKKLLVLSLALSIFTLFGNKEEINVAHAGGDEPTPDVIVPGSYSGFPLYQTGYGVATEPFFSTFASDIVSIKLTNDPNVRPASSDCVCEPIMLLGDIHDGQGNLIHTEYGELMYAYITEATGSTSSKKRYDCVFYAAAETFCINDNANYLFSGFDSLETIDLSNVDTSIVEDMEGMFANCPNLKSVDLSALDTSKVKKMTGMFVNCTSLASVNLTGVDTSIVTDMTDMFNGCSALASIDLSGFKNDKVTAMDRMFMGCSALKRLDLSNFNLSSVSKLDALIAGTNNLEYLKCPQTLPDGYELYLPFKINKCYGIASINSSNLSEYPVFNVPAEEFVKSWRSLRTEADGICGNLVSGSENNISLLITLEEYKTFDEESKKYIYNSIDKDDVTIGETMEYIKNVMDGKQTTNGEYGYNTSKEDFGSFMTISVTEESPYLIVIVSLMGVLVVLGYYFYNKRKQEM